MRSNLEPEGKPSLKMPWTFMIVVGLILCALIVFIPIPEPYGSVLAIMTGLSVRRLGNAWPKFYGNCKISLNKWLTK